MKLLKLAIKNAIVVFWRSLTIGVFLFFLGFLMIFVSSFSQTVRDRMENAVINAFTGHIQLRPGASQEEDIADLMKTSWDDIPSFSGAELETVYSVLRQYPEIEYTARIRNNALLVSDTEMLPSMSIGIDPGLQSYKQAFTLLDGRYLEPGNAGEVLLTERQAKRLGVKVGDTLGALAQTQGGNPDVALTVVGIGSIVFISGFGGLDVAFIDLDTARELIGYTQGQASDVLVYVKDKDQTEFWENKLNGDFSGMKALLPAENPAALVKVTDYISMGGFFRGVAVGGTAFFSILIALLMLIVSILIINLILMMGFERYEEIGTMRALGFGKWSVIRIFLWEIIFITLVFGTLGILAGTGLVLFFSKTGMPSPAPSMAFVMGERLFFKFHLSDLITSVCILFLFPLAAALIPAWRASSIKPAQALRTE